MSDDSYDIRLMAHMPIFIDPKVPLTTMKRDPETGEEREVDALCVIVGGNILVHPDRMPLIEEAFRRQGALKL